MRYGRAFVRLTVLPLFALVPMLALAAVAPPARADAVADFYKGRQLNMIVFQGAGTTYDTYAHLLAKHMGGHIPGSPSSFPRTWSAPAGSRRPSTSTTSPQRRLGDGRDLARGAP